MNPGKLRERGQILTLVSEENAYRWEASGGIWCEVKETGKKNLFSKVGIGTVGAEITVRENSHLTCHNALLVRGQHFFLTDIAREGIAPRYYKIQAAFVSPETAIVTRTKVTIEANGIPINGEITVAECPVCLTEKYIRSADEKAQVENTCRLVAVAPKVLECLPGDIMEILGRKYRVEVCHNMEPYKNEYEIERVTDD